MSNVIALANRPLSPRRAMERIRLLWRSGKYFMVPHAKKRMRERGFDVLDVEHLFRLGKVVDTSRPGNLWRYKVAGTAVDGGRMACVVEMNGSLIVVTVI